MLISIKIKIIATTLKVILNLAICHTIIIEKKNGAINYNASSPDELALVNAARFFGYKFVDRD